WVSAVIDLDLDDDCPPSPGIKRVFAAEMKLTRSYTLFPGLMIVVPLINVLFLVVVFFAMSSRFVLQPGLAVTLPLSPFSLTPPREPQIVSITSTPVPAIYHREQKVTVDELVARLRDMRTRDRSLIIKADRGTSYDLVIQIANQALQNGFSVMLAAQPAGT
ncbi:MAG TPA: biopolymer transporter ExbD, partial [Chthoniobacteraceae bacterium]|nr:biopolymer transporter ExbD [Chthoniobacteraceae bacterium]